MQTITTIGLDIAQSINVAGLAGLRNLKSPGAGSKLTARQRAELAELVEGHPDPACTGSGVGGRVDLRDRRHAQRPTRTVQLAKLQSLQFRRTRRQNVRLGHARGLIRASAAPGGQDFMLVNAAPSRRHPSFRRPCEKSWLEPRCKTTAAAPTAPPESW